MTAILATGFPVERFVEGEGTLIGIGQAPSREDLSDLVDRLHPVLAHGQAVITIHSGRTPEPIRRRLGTVRAALDHQMLAFHATSLPPLAGGILAALAAALAARTQSAAELLAALPALERELLWITWLNTVKGLREPSPSVAQHAAGLLPGRSFAAVSWPEPAVHTLTRHRRIVPLPQAQHDFHLAIAGRESDLTWAEELGAALDNPPTRHYDPTPTGPDWWGTARIVEAVAYPVDLDELYAHTCAGMATAPCPWCGQAVTRPPCPFCGHAGEAGVSRRDPGPREELAA